MSLILRNLSDNALANLFNLYYRYAHSTDPAGTGFISRRLTVELERRYGA